MVKIDIFKIWKMCYYYKLWYMGIIWRNGKMEEYRKMNLRKISTVILMIMMIFILLFVREKIISNKVLLDNIKSVEDNNINLKNEN